MNYYKEEDFYKDNGWPSETLAYCDYWFYIDSVTEFGRDYNQFALITNAYYPYIRLTKKRGQSHFPCGYCSVVSTDGYFAQKTDEERDEECPKIAWGLAAMFLFFLRYDKNQKDFVLKKKKDSLFEEYYKRYLDDYLANHSGLKYSAMTVEEKELDFLAEHSKVSKDLWEKCEPLKQYSVLYEYTKETELQYEAFLQKQKQTIMSAMSTRNSFCTEIRQSPREKYVKVFFLDDSVAQEAKTVVEGINSVRKVIITESHSSANSGQTLTVYVKPMVVVEECEKEIIEVLKEFFSGIVVGKMNAHNEAYFDGIEFRLLDILDKAMVSIDVCVAWFTNPKLRDKLLERILDDVDVRVIIYNDGVNARNGVDLTGINHKEYRGERGGILHDKFCVIDNVHTICGSYNWTLNAEHNNDEDVTFHLDDSRLASQYSRRFKQMWKRDGAEG